MLPVGAQNIHLHYYEAWDSELSATGIQQFSFAGEANQAVTIVSYGLDEQVIPDLVVLDPSGLPLAENFNDDFSPVISSQVTLPAE